jgi:hypothetical protein
MVTNYLEIQSPQKEKLIRKNETKKSNKAVKPKKKIIIRNWLNKKVGVTLKIVRKNKIKIFRKELNIRFSVSCAL